MRVAVASTQRRETVQTLSGGNQTVAVGARRWFGHLDVERRDEFGLAVTHAFNEGGETFLVLPDGREGIIAIDDLLWFEGRGPWPERVGDAP